MKCHTPDCIGEREPREVSHRVVYMGRTVTVHAVPAHVCPECGDIVLAEETVFHVETLLRAKSRSKGDAFTFAPA